MLRLLTTAAFSTAFSLAVASSASATAEPVDTIEEEEPSVVVIETSLEQDADVLVEDEPIETFYDVDELGKRTSYKCRSAKVAYVKKTLLGALSYKWWMKRSWCWRPDARIVSAGTTTWVTDMDGFNVYNGIVQAWGRWIQWCCSEPRSGHRAFRQAEFQNCIFKYGCLSTTYPWIRMTVRGDGTYAYTIGD